MGAMLWLLLWLGRGAMGLPADAASVLASMTLEEKARQLDIFRTADILTNGRVNMSKARSLWGDLELGVGVLHDVYAYPELANEIMGVLINVSRSGVPPLVGAEATHGLQMDDHTIFPSPIGLAATWDVDLMGRYGAVVGSEARSSGIHVTWAPVLGLCVEPRWGRCEEMLGECPHLAGALGAATVRGLTDDGHYDGARGVAPLLKHYLAYSVPEGGHNAAPAHVGRREALTRFLPPFAEAIDAGAQAVMASYNEVDGEPNAGSSFALSSLLRDGGYRGSGPRTSFDGYISADFGAIHNLNGVHAVVSSAAAAVATYLTAGGSVSGFDFSHTIWNESIVNGVLNGTLPESALDDAVGRVLTVKSRLGLLKSPFIRNTSAYYDLITSDEHRDVAVEAAQKSIVLLQNQDVNGAPVLPFNAKHIKTLAVVGPNGDQPQCGDYAAGGSWGGDRCGGGPINNARTSSILGGIKALYPHIDVTYAPGAPISDFNASAPYFTTIQSHSYSADAGRERPGIWGRYWGVDTDPNAPPVLERNDYMISFHLLNYGPAPRQGMAASAFRAEWTGFVTPDSSVDGVLFRVEGQGSSGEASLEVDGKTVLRWNSTNGNLLSQPVDIRRGVPLNVTFRYQQGDSTGSHPAFALQWSLQGDDARGDAVAAARAADATLVVLGGGTSKTSGEGIDRASLALPGTQLSLLQDVAGVVKRNSMALVVAQGKPFAEPWIKQFVPAVLEVWQGGQAQGEAVARAVFGDYNPAGRTAVSFPSSADVLPAYYNHKPSASRGGYSNPPLIPGGLYPPSSGGDTSVLWAFGHGLSYGATFNYSALRLNATEIGPDGAVAVQFTITNSGSRDAEEVAQLYVRDVVGSVTTPVKQLRGFTRISVPAGATVPVTMQIRAVDHLWLVNGDMKRVVEPGEFTLMVGGASDAIQQSATLRVVSKSRGGSSGQDEL